MPELIFGTAALGSAYGVSNGLNAILEQDAAKVLRFSQEIGINAFDTAPAYGKAEEYIGKYLDGELYPKISTKISSQKMQTSRTLIEAVKDSLERLQCHQIENLFLHDPANLQELNLKEVQIGLQELLDVGIIKGVGVSVYDLKSVFQALEVLPQITVFQVPENVCDQRLLNSNEIMDLSLNGSRFIVRSVFLQGLLLMNPVKIPANLHGARAAIERLNTLSQELNCSTLDLCLNYARKIPWASGVIVSAVTCEQLREIADSTTLLPQDWNKNTIILSEELLDPRRWES